MRNFKYWLILLLFLIIPNVKGVSYDYANVGYAITNYDVTIDVNDDNSYDIKEVIEVYFYTQKHGIYRTLPLSNIITRLDGSVSKNSVKISNLKVSDNYKTSYEDGNYKIQIGDANKYVSGSKTYTISYNYNIGKDKLKDKDEFYFNIIGTEWETFIAHVDFTINMPKEFDTSKVGFSSGSYGSTTNNVNYTISGNTINGETTSYLYSNEALTIRMELEEGYFANAKSIRSTNEVMAMFLPVVCLVICILIYVLKSKKSDIVDPVTFYPPDGLNSLEVAFLYKGSVTSEDVTSLLVYLADKGYIKIEEKESKSVFSATNNVKFIKLKDYDGEKLEEQLFLEGLFKNGDTVSLSSLKSRFYITINEILDTVNKKENKEKVINKNNGKYKFLMAVLAYLAVFGTIFSHLWGYVNIGYVFGIFVLTLFYMPFIYAAFKVNIKFVSIFILGFIIIHALAMFGGFLGRYYFLFSDAVWNILFGVAAAVIIIILIKKFVYRTDYGKEMYGKILGFKKFLMVAEKEKLESLVNQNPDYFYNILPFTYVLGISNKWIKKFESIAIEPASWYSGYDTFNAARFGAAMGSYMSTCRSYVTTSRGSGSSGGFSSSSGGSSSGGGSSGGGSGGGGGGSW